MARIRTIKPEFFTSEDIVELSAFARLFYISIWCEADREGRLEWKPNTFKLRYFPADKIDIHKLCDELIGRGLVVLYGNGLAYVPKFLVHQHINPRESQSNLPAPEIDASPRVSDASARDSDAQGGRERKGKEGYTSRHDAKEVLDYLNQKAKREYRPVDSNLKLIVARLDEGATVDECKKVIDSKVTEWLNDPKMSEYLRPETLFNATKFAGYIGKIGTGQVQHIADWRQDPRFKGCK